MGLFGKNYYEVGKNDSAEEFLKVFRKAKESKKASEHETALVNGAVQAFREGRPANVRAALWNADELDRTYRHFLAASILKKITENSNDQLADIDSALKGMPEQQKTKTLTSALMAAINYYGRDDKFLSLMLEAVTNAIADEPEQQKRNVYTNALQSAITNTSEAFCASLLEHGADANTANNNGYAGGLLVTLSWNRAPESKLKLLYDHGASFDDAIAGMVYSGWNNQEQIERLKFYKQRIAGADAPPVAGGKAGNDDDLRQTIRELKEQVRDLTDVVGALTKEFRKQNGSAPAEPQPEKEPARKAPHQYPSL